MFFHTLTQIHIIVKNTTRNTLILTIINISIQILTNVVINILILTNIVIKIQILTTIGININYIAFLVIIIIIFNTYSAIFVILGIHVIISCGTIIVFRTTTVKGFLVIF